LRERLQALAADPGRGNPESGKDKRAIVDFGGPNVAKPMHVGHLRATIIGDSLQRLFRANGWGVVSDVHLGDWGLPMGQLITEVKKRQPGLPYFDANVAGPYPAQSPVSMDDLEELYPVAPPPVRPIRCAPRKRGLRRRNCRRAGRAIARCGSIS
jgi:arginyl-tRNA synthetase